MTRCDPEQSYVREPRSEPSMPMCNGIQRARRAPPRHLQHMDVDYRCRQVGMPQKLVHGSDLGTHLLDAEAILHVLDSLAQLVQKPVRLPLWRAGFDGILITGRMSRKLINPPSGKPLMGGIHDQLMEQRPTYRAGFALDITLGLTEHASARLSILYCRERTISICVSSLQFLFLKRPRRNRSKALQR